jgi:hypothetical protein
MMADDSDVDENDKNVGFLYRAMSNYFIIIIREVELCMIFWIRRVLGQIE